MRAALLFAEYLTIDPIANNYTNENIKFSQNHKNYYIDI
jgi:hypothetical protein